MVCLCGAVIIFLMLYRLGSLTNGLSNAELGQQQFASSWHHIAHNPLNAPLSAVEWLLLTIFANHSATVTRLGSAVFGVLALVAFAYVLRRWYGIRTAFFGTILFGFSSWFLHISRLASPEVLYLWAVPTLLATHIAWERHIKKSTATFFAIVVFGILLYIPGMLWLVILSLGLQSHHLVNGWKQLKRIWQRIVLILLFLLILTPLAIALIQTPSLIQTWLGLPQVFNQPGEMPKRLVQSISFLVWRGPKQPELWLDRLPILDVFSILMAFLGVIFYIKHLLAPRTRLLVGIYIIGAFLYALGGSVGFSVLIPVVYLIIAAGVGYLLHEWFRVFPRNPLARSVGLGLMGLAIGFACLYNFRAYFVAWPHNTATTTVFRGSRK